MKKLIDRLPPGRIHEIHERLKTHFLGEGHFGEKLAQAFRDASNRVSQLAVVTQIPEKDLTSFLWGMAMTQGQAMHREVEAAFGATQKQKGPWCMVADRRRSLI